MCIRDRYTDSGICWGKATGLPSNWEVQEPKSILAQVSIFSLFSELKKKEKCKLVPKKSEKREISMQGLSTRWDGSGAHDTCRLQPHGDPAALAHSRLKPSFPAASHSQPAPTPTLRVPLHTESFGGEK